MTPHADYTMRLVSYMMEAVESQRGRPRSAEADAALTLAVRELLRTIGYPSMSIEAVAVKAGVGKATIYRRWTSKAEMVFALVIHDTQIELPAHSRSLPQDVSALVTHVVRLLTEPSARAALPGLLADVADDPALADRFHATFIQPQRELVAALLKTATDRGELVRVPDAKAVHARILGAVFTPLFLLAEPPPDDLSARVTTEILTSLPTTRQL